MNIKLLGDETIESVKNSDGTYNVKISDISFNTNNGVVKGTLVMPKTEFNKNIGDVSDLSVYAVDDNTLFTVEIPDNISIVGPKGMYLTEEQSGNK